ncbi:2-C-methyl-D-erythritol 4-phosphate cytidylyltransferase [Corynebacterium poyangense]|uniref:2-C-methyl-D-erythritol 4-phosphate cytidylyltransferase n=1 Tax=Corynebacterium poyangense TaxID=2684405 RepID=A0A7H0SR34_9CORY|nr:2-C-methyl-D-erythritol 4-phosphate cytidylyltransferase [Corynebacterium poyangense]
MSKQLASESRRAFVLIAAAGQGTRLGASLPKAYVSLAGVTLLERSVRTFLEIGQFDAIHVMVSPEWEDYARRLLMPSNMIERVVLVHGGAERMDSVWAGLQSLPAEEGTVLIHDAARALTPPEMICRVLQNVNEDHPAVIPVLPVSDTIKQVDESESVVATPDRNYLRAVQTPQGFDLATLRQANLRYFQTAAAQRQFLATDDASLMEWCGVPVYCVPGDARALKITTPWDLQIAELLIRGE